MSGAPRRYPPEHLRPTDTIWGVFCLCLGGIWVPEFHAWGYFSVFFVQIPGQEDKDGDYDQDSLTLLTISGVLFCSFPSDRTTFSTCVGRNKHRGSPGERS